MIKLKRPCLFMLLFTSMLCYSNLAHADTPSVEIKNNLITIKAVSASLIAITNRLSELTDIPISYTDGNDQNITIEIFEETLKATVTKLSENNLIVTKKVNGEDVITEIMIMLPETSGGSSDSNLPSGAPVDEVYVEPITEVEEPIEVDINGASGIDPTSEQTEPVMSQ